MQIAIAALLSALLFSNAAAATEHYYSDLTDPPRQLIIQEHGVSFGGVLAPVEFCPPKSDSTCFSSAGVKFAVPKTIGSKSSWEFDGATYELKRRERFPLLGQTVEIMFIEQVQGNRFLSFFSRKRVD